MTSQGATAAHTSDPQRDALEAARNGLQWYRDAYPEADSGADDEMMAQIDAALASPALAPTVPNEPFGPMEEGWTLSISDGHSGYGVYATSDEYPEEGSHFLIGVPAPAAANPAVRAEPLPLPGALVVVALQAMDAEARKRGAMFPQTRDEQEEDTAAVRRVIKSIEFYASERHSSNGWPGVKGWPALPDAIALPQQGTGSGKT